MYTTAMNRKARITDIARLGFSTTQTHHCTFASAAPISYLAAVVTSKMETRSKTVRTAEITADSTPLKSADEPSSPDPGRPVYFWRESHPQTGFLSQWYSSYAFTDPSESDPSSSESPKVYRSAEHYMMHHKALLFGDASAAAAILAASHPRKVKSLGRAVRGYSDEAWFAEREGIVRRGNYCKFTYPVVSRKDSSEARDWRLGTGEGPDVVTARSFREALLRTGDRELVEASPFDRVWGIGFREETAEQSREAWGENLLGKALMSVRDEFRKELQSEQGKTE
ncbi:hypothetical protein BX600DRAFT_467261 [Xylariales sp. PMI_506]|nr:hypothetical protein BX600DRAFT_467261 [Xylariales sp. PMI_506]